MQFGTVLVPSEQPLGDGDTQNSNKHKNVNKSRF